MGTGLAPGARLGPYEILAALGAGGMGEVYRARDTRLARDVAIKVLPISMSADPDRLRRFELEARSAAALNHPGILAVYDIGSEADSPYIVSELLEGETLRARLARGSETRGSSVDSAGTLSVRKAIDYAVQIAKALSAAHEKGIVHRDLKPENLFITTDGRVKILDFGLAKLTEHAHASQPDATALPTSAPGTEAGIVLGTTGYMSPEQVRGHAVDHRTDIFAFGAVLYEMLAGQRAFSGATPADTMSAILDKDPPDLPTATARIPPALARVVERCLEKSPSARFHSAHDLAFALEALSAQSDSSTAVSIAAAVGSPRRVGGREKFAWGTAALLVVALGATGVLWPGRRPDPAPTIRFWIRPPAGATLVTGSIASSPDGTRLIYAATRAPSEPQTLWLQSIDRFEAELLPGTEDGGDTFWSPDGKQIGFFANGKLKTFDIEDRTLRILGDTPVGGNTGGSWGKDGVILIGVAYGGLMRTSTSGAALVPATQLDNQQQEVSHRRPSFMPDGRHFTYVVQPGNHVFLGVLDSPERTSLLNADSRAVYAGGYLVFARQTSLFAQPFDVSTNTLSGRAIALAEQVTVNPTNANAPFAASGRGVLLYETGVVRANPRIPMQLTWFDRSGKTLGVASDVGDYRSIELSPDGRTLAEHHHENETGGDMWLRDLVRGASTRLTFGGHNTEAIWSPDGARIVYGSNVPLSGPPPKDLVYGGTFNLFAKRADGGSETATILNSASSGLTEGWKQPTSWSPDGQFILFDLIDPKTQHDIWLLPLTGERKPRPWLQTEFREMSAQVSPDGKWVAYQSDETRRFEIYVRPLSGPSKTPISTAGGTYARWRADGKELYYISPANKLMSVAIRTSGEAIDVGAPVPLFDVRVAFPSAGVTRQSNTPFPYSTTKDGQRFLVSVDMSPPPEASPLSVVLNWAEGLKK